MKFEHISIFDVRLESKNFIQYKNMYKSLYITTTPAFLTTQVQTVT